MLSKHVLTAGSICTSLQPVIPCGQEIELKYMPTSLILRAVDAPWTLPSGDLPSLPPSFSRRGRFQLVPREERFKRTLAKDVQIEIRRGQFAVLPADTRVVYGAQGNTSTL